MSRRRVLSSLRPFRQSYDYDGNTELVIVNLEQVPITEWFSVDGTGAVKELGQFPAWVIHFEGQFGNFIKEMDKMDIKNYYLGSTFRGSAIFPNREDALFAYLKLK